MRQVTIAIEDDVLQSYKQYAQQHGLSLDELIQRVLSWGISPARADWLEDCFRLMDRAGANSGGRRWKREDLYDV